MSRVRLAANLLRLGHGSGAALFRCITDSVRGVDVVLLELTRRRPVQLHQHLDEQVVIPREIPQHSLGTMAISVIASIVAKNGGSFVKAGRKVHHFDRLKSAPPSGSESPV